MFRILNILTIVVIAGLNQQSVLKADELFSDIRPLSVFDTATTEESVSKPALSSRRITDSKALQKLMQDAELQATVDGVRDVVTEKQLDQLSFPVRVSISEDEVQVQIVLGLQDVQNPVQQLPVETLLAFMAASQKHAPALFSWHGDRKKTELSIVMENKGLTGQALRDQINRLAVIARDNAKLWTLPASSSNDESSAAPAPESAKAETSASQLTGKWSAARSNTEAFAVEFTKPAKFQLVYIKDGQQTRSAGSFTIADNTLTLTGTDGLKLQGNLKIVTPDEFRFQPTGASELVFSKAK